MTVHLYAQCWNDEDMLPFFFRHYDRLVDQYFMFDDGSTDGTRSILGSHPRVRVERFPREVQDSFAFSEKAFSDSCWKTSRGAADWVIMTDVDEHLFHPDLAAYLRAGTERGVTFIPAYGFQMISDDPPSTGTTLCDDYPIGAPWSQMMKASVFAPDAFTEVNYTPGRHRAAPEGRIILPQVDELLLFHYKYLGFRRTYRRHKELLSGLGSVDLERGFGHKYSWSEAELRADWEDVQARAIDTRTVRRDPSLTYPYKPWWSDYDRAASNAESS